MGAATRSILTLRARAALDPPRAGELMASQSGKTVYRVLTVTRIRVAGDPTKDRFRLSCEPVRRSEVPEGTPIHPWRWAPRPARQTRRGGSEAPRAVGEVRPPPSKAVSGLPGGRTRGVHFPGADLGPGIRRRSIRDREGRLLREADVVVDDRAADPRAPNRHLRRAYRVDPVDLLRRGGSIGPRETDAVAELRRHLERITPTLGAGSAMRISIAGHLIQPITDEHIKASRKLREASAALGPLWPPVLWVCLGGGVKGYAAQTRIRPVTAYDQVHSGMQRLADHFYGRAA
jgi:hypothetical protein